MDNLGMPRDIYLPLYGRLQHGSHEDMAWDLYQTPEVSRLRDISLACTPSRYVPHGQAANRFQHSVGASVLARMLCSSQEELKDKQNLLVACCLLHDSASPPFSHIAEPFLHALTGQHHEQAVAGIIQKEGPVREALTEHSVSPEQVIETICGQGLYGPLMAGSIDLDNLDNSLHLLISLGFAGKLPYSPKRLVKAFRFENSKASIALDELSLQQLLGWRAARSELYGRPGSLVYLSSTSMLYRAIDLCDQQTALGEDFFSLDETQALAHLQESCEQSRMLLESLATWRQYPCLLWLASSEQDPRVSAIYGDTEARRRAANRLAEILDIPAHHLCLYAGKAKGNKAIDLPFEGQKQLVAAAEQAFAATAPGQQVSVFIEKSHALSSQRVMAAWQVVLDSLPEAPESHCFF
jgi:HD superfamily phosphohydrolase